eukprot:PhF_6_TR2901/c0_g1_i1/m.4473
MFRNVIFVLGILLAKFSHCQALNTTAPPIVPTNTSSSSTSSTPSYDNLTDDQRDILIGVLVGVGVPLVLVSAFVLIRLKYYVEGDTHPTEPTSATKGGPATEMKPIPAGINENMGSSGPPMVEPPALPSGGHGEAQVPVQAGETTQKDTTASVIVDVPSETK